MKIKYLGTAAAERIPAMFCKCDLCMKARKNGGKDCRTQSQLLIDDGKLMIDFPGDAYLNAMKNGVDLSEVEALLITHWHSDHFYGEDLMMRQMPYALGLEKVMEIYGSGKVYKFYKRAVFLEGNKEPEFLKYKIIQPFLSFKANGYNIWAFLALHGEKNGDCLFYAVSDGAATMLYAHDTGKFDEQIYEYMKKESLHFNFVSLDCTHQNCASSDCHMNLEGNREVKERLIRTGLADENTIFVLNHFSHNGKLGYDEMKKLGDREGFLVSYDGMEVDMIS